MSTTDAEQEQTLQQLAQYVADQLNAGKSPVKIKHELIAEGVPEEVATEMIAAVRKHLKSGGRNAGMKQFGIGIGLAGLGGIITAVSYNSAAPGGSYTVMTGLIVVGVIYALMGLFRMLTG